MSNETYERNKEGLKKLQRQRCNRKCADCEDKSPTWASWNLGCFICMNCAAHHRGMGVHISKVRSATMDHWNDKMITHFKRRGGNAGVNALYEAKLAAGVKSSSMNVREFIRDKYERKRWYKKPTKATVVKSKPAMVKTKLATVKNPAPVKDLVSFEDTSMQTQYARMSTDRSENIPPANRAAEPPSAAPATKTESLQDLWRESVAQKPAAVPRTAYHVPPNIIVPGGKASIMNLFKRAPAAAANPPQRSMAAPATSLIRQAMEARPSNPAAPAPYKTMSVQEAMRQAFGSHSPVFA